MYRLNYGGCSIEKVYMDSADAVIPILQNECQSHAFEAKHVNWDAGRDRRFCIRLPILESNEM